jgi:hypothetical protein
MCYQSADACLSLGHLRRLSISSLQYWDGGHEHLISNGGRFKPAFAEKDKKENNDRSPNNLNKLVLKPVMSLPGYGLWIGTASAHGSREVSSALGLGEWVCRDVPSFVRSTATQTMCYMSGMTWSRGDTNIEEKYPKDLLSHQSPGFMTW